MLLLPQPGLPCISSSSHALDLGAMELPDNRGDALGGGSAAGSNPVGLSLQCNGYGSHARTNMMQGSNRDKQPSRAHTALLPSNSASGVLNESWRFNANFRSPHEWSFLGFPGLAATTKANGGQHVTQYPAYPSHTQPATRITNPLGGQRRHPDTRTGCDQ